MINNVGFDKNTTKKLHTQRSVIYCPKSEEDWKYAHHPFVTFFKGRFYAIWSSGRVHEDVLGQRVMISSSADALQWEKPIPLLDSVMGEHVETTLTAAGFYSHNGQLNAYIGQYEFDVNAVLPLNHIPDRLSENKALLDMFPKKTHRNTKMLIMTTEDGLNFRSPVDTQLPIIPNIPPQRLHSGRLLISGNIMFPYSDDPYGVSGWTKTGIYSPCESETVYDDSEGLEAVKIEKGWPSHRCEGSFYQMPDGTVNMLLRSGYENNHTIVLYCSQSKDNGETWSEPFATNFTNDASKFHVGCLPDGRFYYVGNPVLGGGRCPLVLSLSENGEDFHQHYILEDEFKSKRFEGLYKGGVYGYPHTFIQGNRMYVIYSVNKEEIAISAFDLESLT